MRAARKDLLAIALVLALVKFYEFGLDSQPLHTPDSAAFLTNAAGLTFFAFRSYVYSALVHLFANGAIVAAQMAMGAVTAWLLAFALVRYFRVHAWIAALAAMAFAIDPVQVVYEHALAPETAALLAIAAYLIAALEYFRNPSPSRRRGGARFSYWLGAMAVCGVLLTSLRTSYVLVVVAAALFLPIGALWKRPNRLRTLAFALAISCGFTLFCEAGYFGLTGWLVDRHPSPAAKGLLTGEFLLTAVLPIVKPNDSADARIASAIDLQNRSALPLVGPRSEQLSSPDGFIARLTAIFNGDERQTGQAARRLALAAILRHPLGFLELGVRTYLGYWTDLPHLQASVDWEFESQRATNVGPTLSRQYHTDASAWYLFLLAAPFLSGLAWLLSPANRAGAAVLFFWSAALLAVVCWGGPRDYLYLHPYSFPGIAAAAIVCQELWKLARVPLARLLSRLDKAYSAIPALTPPQALLWAALLIALFKIVEFNLDSQALVVSDSGAFLLNAVGLVFMPFRSLGYSALIHVFAQPFHSLRAVVAMQMVMTWFSAWLLAFMLLRHFRIRGWVALLAALAFAVDPSQLFYDHMIMSETTSELAMALYLVAALEYLRNRSPWRLVVIAFLGVALVSVRTVYAPVIIATAPLPPIAAWLMSGRRRWRTLAFALALSCGAAVFLQAGFGSLVGWLQVRDAKVHIVTNYRTGFFLLAAVSPLVEAGDAGDPGLARLIDSQSQTIYPLARNTRSNQLWQEGGLVDRMKARYGEQAADQAAQRVAMAAIRRNPLGFLNLGLQTWFDYARQFPFVAAYVTWEDGTATPTNVDEFTRSAVLSAFHADINALSSLRPLSLRYHTAALGWYGFLLAAPFLSGFACWLYPVNRLGSAILLLWSAALLAATLLGAVNSPYRYLHPFSFTAIAAGAMLSEARLREIAAARRAPESYTGPVYAPVP